MKVNFDSNYSNKNVNFCALKSVTGIDKIECLVGHIGRKSGNYVVNHLKANSAFNELCKDFDVYVKLLPVMLPSKKTPVLVDNGMHLEIFAQKPNKKKFAELLGKKNPLIKVSDYKHKDVEARPFDIAEYIVNDFINKKNGLEKDINTFLKQFSETENSLKGYYENRF